MPNANMYVTVKRVNPERLRCPVKDCTAEGKEENRVDTPFIAGLGPMTVYLCDAHASVLAVMFLDKNEEIDAIQWDEPIATSMPNPTPEQLNDPLFQAIWDVIKSWDINVPEYYQGYCGANGSHVMLLWNALSQVSTKDQLPGEAGALFAFTGWLSTREQVSGPFSRNENPTQAAQLVRQFIDMQGWPDPPDGWWHCIKPYTEEEKEALGRVHLENYTRTHIAHIEPISELEDISYGRAPLEEV